MQTLSPDKFDALASRAIAAGGVLTSPIAVKADFAGTCQAPLARSFKRGNDPTNSVLKPRNRLVWSSGQSPEKPRGTHGRLVYIPAPVVKAHRPRYLDVTVPCRKCAACRRAKSRRWRNRAEIEIASAFRTWFVTFTVAPEHRVRVAILASRAGHEDFAGKHKVLSREFTLFFKRVRKNSGQALRYMLVAEAHKDGFPHYHALVHEHGEPIPRRLMEAEWKLGFTHFRLADAQAAKYVSKYISKDAHARVRASVRYGTSPVTVRIESDATRVETPLRGKPRKARL